MKHTHTLWIEPPQNIAKILQDIVDKLGHEFNGPVFQPHMTLLGDIPGKEEEILEKAVLLAKELEPFEIELGEVSFSTTYYRNVFIRVKSSAKLMDANMKAKEIYGYENDIFMPHMSLLYGNHDVETREKIANQVQIPKGLSFTVDNLVLVPNTPVTPDWKPVAVLPLNK